MNIDLSPLARAVARLEEGYARYLLDEQDSQIRDGLIQRFEFTYEISHKTLKRFLRAKAASPDLYDDLAFADLIRQGKAHGLLASDWPVWRQFREMRGRTSHSYDEQIALMVVADIPEFIAEARHLLTALQQGLLSD